MTTARITTRQREVLNYLSKHGALSPAKAHAVVGFDEVPAEKLARRGILNKRYIDTYGAAYWIRGEYEAPTGTSVPAGFVVILNRDVTTPSGKRENFFLARAVYDGGIVSFRRLLYGWLRALGLRDTDLLYSSNGFELLDPDSPVFSGDHKILETSNCADSPAP